MAYFALLWKARTIEKYRSRYEKEKLDSIIAANAELPRHTFGQKWKIYRYDSQKKLNRIFRKLCPEGSKVSNFFIYLKTDQTFANFLVKSVIGFVGGIVLTYFWFMFFVFQLSISLVHATIMSSIIGVALTLGLAFSYRVRCLVFLLIPQFFSRVGRYTLTCYALVLILTGPATNTMKNSEVLSESLACGQEQVKSSVSKISKSMQKPLHLIKDTMDETVKKLKYLAAKTKELMVKIHRLTMSLAHVLQSSLAWLNSVEDVCNTKLGTPYEHCLKVLGRGEQNKNLRNELSNFDRLVKAVCLNLKSVDAMCVAGEYTKSSIVATVKKKLQTYSDHISSLVSVNARVRRSYGCCNATSANQAAGGTVTEIRRRADPLLTWLSWSACLTSLFLLLIIFRGKYYQQMFQTRSRFDNRYVTKELRDLDFRRLKQGRETVLPLNTRERAKYVSTTSFRLLASERVHLTRSFVFMVITTFKLLIHIVADYSLYWVLMNIRFHGRFQAPLLPGDPTAGIQVAGSGPLAGIVRTLLEALSIPLSVPAPSPISCLPNPHPPDFQRYAQIGVLILLLWVFALFEPYGLRLRHVIMSRYQPERARARAEWLHNHIVRTRGSFLKYARRKLHREYKYSSEERYTFRRWLNNFIPCRCVRFLLRIGPEEPHCLLCSTKHTQNDSETHLKRCDTPSCPGTYCARCFADIGQLCTICLSPEDYGDLSDVSLEKGSSDESDSEDPDYGGGGVNKPLLGSSGFKDDQFLHGNTTTYRYENSPKAKNNNSQGATLNFVSSKQYIDTKRDIIQEYIDQVDDESAEVNDEPFTSDSIIPVVVRDKERLLKNMHIPKEKLTGVINTMKLLTTKMADSETTNLWNMHESKTFEYLVMNLMEPVDIFKKALIVRQTKLNDADSRIDLNDEGKNESLKQLVPFLCAYSVHDIATNKFNNPDSFTRDSSNLNVKRTVGKLALDIKKEHTIDEDSKISQRDTKIIKRRIPHAIKARVIRSDNVLEELRKRRIKFNTTKQRCHKYHYRNTSFNNRRSYQIEIKCRAYKLDKATFSGTLSKKISKVLSANKCADDGAKCLAKNNALSEDIKCYVRSKSQKSSNNVSSNIKPSDLKYADANEKPNDIQNRRKEKNTLLTIHDIINRHRKGKRSLYSRLWIQTKPVFVVQKLRIFAKKPGSILPNNITNHKRRKKRHMLEPNLSTQKRILTQQDNDDARNFRLSRYLKDQEDWFAEQLQKDRKGRFKDRYDKTKKIWNASINNFLLHIKEKTIKRKDEESDYKKKIAQKQLVRELKNKAKAEEKLKLKLKKEANKHKRIKDMNVYHQTQKVNDGKMSKETQQEKKIVIESKNEDGIALMPITEETSRKEKYSYAPPKLCESDCLNFFGFNDAPIDLPEESIDLDKIFNDESTGDSPNVTEEGNPKKEMVYHHQHNREDPHCRVLWPSDMKCTKETPSLIIIESKVAAKEKHGQEDDNFCTHRKITPEQKCSEHKTKETEIRRERHKIILPKKKSLQERSTEVRKEFGCNVQIQKCGVNVDHDDRGDEDDDDEYDYRRNDRRPCHRSDFTQVPSYSKSSTRNKINENLKSVASDIICGVKIPVKKMRHYFNGLRIERRLGKTKINEYYTPCNHEIETKEQMHKTTQAQLTKLRHCDAQCDNDNSSPFGRDKGTRVSPISTCTCAAQCSRHVTVARVDVGTLHYNAMRESKDSETQYEVQVHRKYDPQRRCRKCSDILQSSNSTSYESIRGLGVDTDFSVFTDLTEIESDTHGTQGTDTRCSVVTIDYSPDKLRKAKKRKVKVAKANQSTLTEKARSVNVSTDTSDWWSPMVEKKTTQSTWQETKSEEKRKMDREIETDGKYLCFKRCAQDIPQVTDSNILSPSLYLFQSQKYYSEMVSSGVVFTPSNLSPHIQKVDKGTDAIRNFRTLRKAPKTKRLEDSPRKRMQTSHISMSPLSWRPADSKDSLALTRVPRRHRNNNAQVARKSRKMRETQDKAVGIAFIKRSESLHAPRNLCSHDKEALG